VSAIQDVVRLIGGRHIDSEVRGAVVRIDQSTPQLAALSDSEVEWSASSIPLQLLLEALCFC